ncbi:MAG: hypothetical protein ACLFR0_03685 [Alphaproteobacteria bacterium]
MNPRTTYLIQIIEKIGGPLLGAVTSGGGKNTDQSVSKDQAEQLAVLLSKTVQLSISLGKMIEIEKTEPELSDSLRLAMAGLAAPIVGEQYKNLGKPPSDDDMQKLGNALEAVMTFSDNFSPSPENAARLKNIQAAGDNVDTHQAQIQYIQAFVPVADSIARFSFGQAEKKMVQDAADKITAKAKVIRSDVFGDLTDKDTQKLYELGILKALTELYTKCHIAEMDKLLSLQEPDANAQSAALKSLWDNFDLRADTLATLAENLVPKSPQSVAPSSNNAEKPITPPDNNAAANVVPPAQNAPPAEPPQTPAQPPQQPPPATPPAPPPPPEQANNEGGQQSGGSPMAMFAKPKTQEEAPSAPPTTLGQNAPPASPPQQQAQPDRQSPAAPFTQPPQENQGSSNQQQSSGGGPMSFFKKPNEGEDEQ